jgi:sec-independent protein translocase protein TatA
MMYPLAFGMPGPLEWILIAGLGLLIFGKRLPEVGRSLGRGIVEFKKGLKGVEDEIEQVDSPTPPRASLEQQQYKFDPYTGKPVDKDAAAAPPRESHSS